MRVVFALSLAAGCGDEQAPKKAPELASIEEPAPPSAPTAWEYDGAPEPAVFDQAALEDTLNAAIRDVMTVSGAAPLLGYVTMMQGADESCPTRYSYDGSEYWIGGCTSDLGVTFDGYVFATDYVDAELLGPDSSMSGWMLNGQAFMTAADGTRLDLAGQTHDIAGTINSGEVPAWQTAVIGTFVWDDEVVADTWLGSELQPTLEATAYKYPLDETGTLTAEIVRITGGLNGLDAEWGTAYLDDIYMVDEIPGFWNCGVEPVGIMSARSPKGDWFQVVFDVTESEDGSYGAPPGTCDGCGIVYLANKEVGEACIDISPLIDWVDQPW
jgi:hypothetical protein